MKLICLPQFDFAGFAYIIHYGLRTFSKNYQGTFLRNYLGDFLALIVILPFLVNVQLYLNCRNKTYITFKEIAFYSALFSAVFEVISPFIFKKGTACFGDCVAYFLGGICLYFSQYLTGEI